MNSERMTSLLQSFQFPPCGADSYFLSFEGVEGAGKSTHIQAFKNHLEGQGLRVLLFREPGGTTFGERLREAILGQQIPLHPLAEAYLFAASRTQLLHEKILQELMIPQTVVILDRYIDSTLVYQGLTRKLGVDLILEIHSRYPLFYLPHLTFYLKIGLSTCLQRVHKRSAKRDYFESSEVKFFQDLIDGYDSLSSLFTQRITTISSEKSKEETFEQILNQWFSFYQKTKQAPQ